MHSEKTTVDPETVLPIDIIIGIAKSIRSTSVKNKINGYNSNIPLAIDLVSQLEFEDPNVLEIWHQSIESTKRLILSSYVDNENLKKSYIAVVDSLDLGMNPEALCLTANNYRKEYFSQDKISLLESISAFLNDPRWDVIKNFRLNELQEAKKSLESALSELEVPSSISGYIQSEIDYVDYIVRNIEKVGQQDAWQRVYFAGASIEAHYGNQEKDTQEKIDSLRQGWLPSALWMAAFSGKFTLGIAGTLATGLTINEYLPNHVRIDVTQLIERYTAPQITDQRSHESENSDG